MKHKAHWLAVGVVSGVAGFILSLTLAIPPSVGPSGQHGEQQRLVEAYGQLPLYFIENQGQLDPQVSYYIQGRDKSIYFTPAGVTFALRGPDAEALEEESPVSRISYRAGSRWTRGADEAARRWVVKLDFVGANGDVRPRGEEPTPAVISYFKGRREEWKAGLGTCASLVYEDLWPGIDLVYRGTVNRLKYTFLVHPGADPEQIRLAYRGAEVSLDQAGQLQVVTPAGGFQDDKPYAYQEDDGQRDEVAAAYVLEGEGAGEGQVYGFRLGAYDPSLPLVIDPAMLVYAGYIGGSGNDFGNGIAVDGAGNAYITGFTLSTEASFPATVGPDLTFNGGVFDAFVAKVNPGGTALVYAGYIGGAGGVGNENGLGIAVDGAGNAYVTGFTRSTEASFPVTVGPDLTFNGGGDAFVAKVAMPRASTITTVSAASFLGPLLTPNSIASGFGSNLATATEAATSVPLPTTLAGTTVTVTDTMGTARLAQLFFVSPGQINYLIPEGTAIGLATVTVTTADGSTLTGSVEIVVVAPGLFTANATGEGVAAAFYLRVAADGTRTQDLIFDPNTLASIPIDLGSEGDQIFLLLFGTGIRGFTSQVTATVGGENVPVLGAVPQGEFVGLDQVNIGPLPRSLAGRGEVDIILTTDGKQANTVTVNIE